MLCKPYSESFYFIYKSIFIIPYVFSIIMTLTLSGIDLPFIFEPLKKNPPQPSKLCLYFTLAYSDHSFAFSTRVFITCLSNVKLNTFYCLWACRNAPLLYFNYPKDQKCTLASCYSCSSSYCFYFYLLIYIGITLEENVKRSLTRIVFSEACVV